MRKNIRTFSKQVCRLDNRCACATIQEEASGDKGLSPSINRKCESKHTEAKERMKNGIHTEDVVSDGY